MLRNRPQWRGGVAVHWVPRPDLDVHVQTVVVGRVPDSSIPTGPRTLDAYARVDGAVTWTPTQHWQVFLAVDNLFNAAYEEFVGFRPQASPPAGASAPAFSAPGRTAEARRSPLRMRRGISQNETRPPHYVCRRSRR